MIAPAARRVILVESTVKTRAFAAAKYSAAGNRLSQKQVSNKKIKLKKVSLAQLFRLLYRFVVLIAAITYVGISFQAAAEAQGVLGEKVGATVSLGRLASSALEYQIGTTTLRESPLVTQFLYNDTSPRNATIYLRASGASFELCDGMTPSAQAIYGTAHLQTLYAAIARDAAYNLTFVAANVSELIAPVIPCDAYYVKTGFESVGVFNFLVRKIAEPEDVYMLTVNLANQIYKISLQKEIGPAAVGTVTFISDLRAANRFECYFIMSLGYPYEVFSFRVYTFENVSDRGSWIFDEIPSGDPTDLAKTVRVSMRSGFFLGSDTEQANIFTRRWLVSTKPIEAISGPEWVSKPYMYNSWGWVHYTQLVFGVDLLLSLVVLVVISYRNLTSGKLWIGDGFVAVSSRTWFRGAFVLLSWYIGRFWSVLEFCVFTANKTERMMNMAIYSTIIYADLLTLYLSICELLGTIFRERVDPLLAMLSFHVGFTYRVALIHRFARVYETVAAFSRSFYLSGMLRAIDDQIKVSPMLFWVPHDIHPVPTNVIVSVLGPIFSMLAVILLYIAVKKALRPDALQSIKTSGNTAISEAAAASMRERLSVLTLFEIATGAQLANRFGLLAEYDNCLFIKGMKFATPDGIYSSGFVIVNQKYLIQANDVWAILLMKFLRLRYTNLYMYEVNGSTVEQRARLVYPDTFTLRELANLNTNILS